MREGEILPWVGLAGATAVPLGVLAWGHPAALWLVTIGVLLLVTFGLVAWRLVLGAAVSTGLWLLGLSWALWSLPARTGGSDGAAGDVDVARVRSYWPWTLLAGLLILSGAALVVRHGRTGSRGTVRRWGRRSQRNDGVASRWQVHRVASGFALRRRAKVLKPSLRGSRVRQRLVPLRELGTRVARIGLWGVWSPIEDVTMRLGGPRSGKSGEIAGRILDAPGAAIATSTRTDLYRLTAPLRERVGPVFVFNPGGLAGLPSTITFDPLAGCENATTAQARAYDLLSGGPDNGESNSEREYWLTLGRSALAALMHAAALGGLGMPDVLDWLAAPAAHANTIERLLRRSTVPTFEAAARQFLGTNDRTQSSITTTIMPALGWLQNQTAAAAAHATHRTTRNRSTDGDDDPFAGTFDVERLLRERGTVYLLGAEDAQTAPLVTALTGHIAREARRLAAQSPTGRLEPPLTLALDEAAIICPLPLESWTADMGGANITIHIGAQSRAQLRQRYGAAGAATIFNNTATVLIFGGTRDDEDLAAYVTLAGERDEDVATFDHLTRRTSTTIRRVPVLTAAQIAQLPFGKVLIIRRGMPAAIGRVQMAWKRRDVRRDQRHRRWAVRCATWNRRVEAWWTASTQAASEWAAPRLERSTERALTVFGSTVERFLAWIDTDPIGSLVRRIRGRLATRRVQAAIRALPARPVDTVRDDEISATSGRRDDDGNRS